MKNYHVLNFEGNFIKEEINLFESKNNEWLLFKVKLEDYVSNNGLNFLNKIKIRSFPTVNFFVGHPNLVTNIHIDNRNLEWALNYVWGSKNSEMSWHTETDSSVTEQTSASTNYIVFDETKSLEIEKFNLYQKLVLVRINVPHRVQNISSDIRYCLSIRGFPKLNWNDIINYLQPYLITNE